MDGDMMPKRKIETKFYCFNQNNSGGKFVKDKNSGIGEFVIIEATDYRDANSRAETIGIYFDSKRDCSCCGSRWSEQCADSDGTEVPSIYDNDVTGLVYEEKYGSYGDPGVSYIHFMDDTVKEVVHKKKGT